MSAAERSAASCCAGLYELPIVEYVLGSSFHPGGAKLTRQLASTALAAPGSDVLDVACGNGSSARLIAAEFGASVSGVDYSVINLRRAIDASVDEGLNIKTQFVCGSADELPFHQKSFDAVLCECSLCLFDNMDTALREIQRVLKPGGRIGISEFFLNAPVPDSLNNILGRVLCVAGALTPDGYRDALLESGFEHIRIRTVNWTLTDMIQRIRKRLALLATAVQPPALELPADWGDPAPVLADLEKFIGDGGTGYLIATARRP